MVTVLGIGVAIPGPFLSDAETIILMSGFPGWETVDINSELSKEFGLPVFLEHDANCGALAELWYGQVGDNDNMVYVVADLGVGAGIVINGKLYNGDLGIAGEIGHSTIDYSGPKCECGNCGCLELYCSTKVLLQEYKKETASQPEYSGSGSKTVEEVLKCVANGDPLARKVFKRVATFLGIGLVNVVNSFNPGLIVIGDRITLAGDYLLEVVDEVLKARLLKPIYDRVEIRLGSFIKDPILYGASALVLQRALKRPSDYFIPNFIEGTAIKSASQ